MSDKQTPTLSNNKLSSEFFSLLSTPIGVISNQSSGQQNVLDLSVVEKDLQKGEMLLKKTNSCFVLNRMIKKRLSGSNANQTIKNTKESEMKHFLN